MNELGFIRQLRSVLKNSHARADAILDDCATLTASMRQRLITSDMLIDGIHFRSELTSYDLIAGKAVRVNLSDLAASGAKPEALLVSLAVPFAWSHRMTLDLMTALAKTAAEFDVAVVGGDTNMTGGPLTICITALGSAHWRGPMLRSGAKPGDLLIVTGRLGGSYRSGRHLSFKPRIDETLWMLDRFAISAMMDVSDGVASDALRLAEASDVTISLDASTVPIHDDVKGTQDERLQQALCDGEDFELLFTIDARHARELHKAWPWPIPLTAIGHCQPGPASVLLKGFDGQVEPLTWRGYDHSLSQKNY